MADEENPLGKLPREEFALSSDGKFIQITPEQFSKLLSAMIQMTTLSVLGLSASAQILHDNEEKAADTLTKSQALAEQILRSLESFTTES